MSTCVLCVVVFVLVLVPLAAALVGILRDWKAVDGSALQPSVLLLLTSSAWALLIGVLATALAIPTAWWLSKQRTVLVPLVMTPLLLPPYLVFAALNLLRAPRTLMGDWLELVAQGGHDWVPLAAGRVLAVLALGLWAWPLAVLVVMAGVQGIDRASLEAARLDRGGFRMAVLLGRMLCRPIVLAIGLVSLVMMGSAVPMHLAQTPTYSMRVWLEMMLSPGSPSAWLSAWPVAVVSGVGGIVVGRMLADSLERRGAHAQGSNRERASRWGGGIFTVAIWLCGTALPLASLIGTADNLKSAPTVLSLHSGAFRTSIGVALAVGVVSALLVAVAWRAFRGTNRGLARIALVLLIASALMPGVLVGGAWLLATRGIGMEWLADSPVTVALAHLSRIAAWPVLIGAWLASREPLEERELRRVDGGGVFGFLVLDWPVQWPALIGVALVAGAMSLHEIEATIMVQPAGVPGLSLTVLGFLHFNRLNDLAIVGGAISIAAMVLVMAGAAVAGRVLRDSRSGGAES